MSQSPSLDFAAGSAACDLTGAAAPSRLQAAGAGGPPVLLSLARSVAAAAAAAEAASAAGAFLAEVDVIIERGIERTGVELHVVARQDLALPGLDGGTPGESAEAKSQDEYLSHEDFRFSRFRISVSWAARRA